MLIVAQTVAQFGLAMTGGSRSKLFAQTAPISMLLIFATIVVFLCWFRRCRLNAEIFAPGTHKYSTGFAVGGWFIPVAMWWIPRRIALDVWRANGSVGGAWMINAWWVAWLAKTLSGGIAAGFQSHPNGYSLYKMVVGVVAAGLAIVVIRQVTAGQDGKARADLAVLPFAPTPVV